jgi:hypothetical protein
MFYLKKIINGRMNVPEPEYLPTTPSTNYSEGMALVLSGGKLVKATGTSKPTHIAMKTYSAPATGNKELPVMRVEKNMVFSAPVTFSTTAVPIVLGSKLTIATDGLGVTDVTTNGVATVVDTLSVGTTNGEEIHVIFE